MDIKSIIKAKGYTIQEVADKMGVNRVTLTITIQGNPTYKKLKEIADAIECDVMDFFKDEAIYQQEQGFSISCPHCEKPVAIPFLNNESLTTSYVKGGKNMKEKFVRSINSHLVLHDTPKVAIAHGYIERVFGMMLSQHIDNYGGIVTNRTLLVGEELTPFWQDNSNEDDSLASVKYLTDFPKLSMKDIHDVIRGTRGMRDVSDSFYDLKKMGCIVPSISEDLIMRVCNDENSYNCYSKDLPMYEIKKGWIPAALEELYSLQSFLNRRVVLASDDSKPADQGVLDFMNEILDNQRKHKVLVDGLYKDGDTFVNDGVYTYSSNGTKTAMTREEFLQKHPEAYEYK